MNRSSWSGLIFKIRAGKGRTLASGPETKLQLSQNGEQSKGKRNNSYRHYNHHYSRYLQQAIKKIPGILNMNGDVVAKFKQSPMQFVIIG